MHRSGRPTSRCRLRGDPAGATAASTREFRYQGDAIVEERVNGTVSRSYFVDESGSVVQMVIPSGQPEPAGTYLVTWNGHGDAMALHRIESTGALTLANSFTYGTWGRPTTAVHNGIADLGFRFTYVGEFDVQWDRELGLDLFYMHARHYNPATGRFIQPDPDRSEANLYAYAANSPVTEIDPDGTCFILCIVIGVAIFGGAGAATQVVTYAATTPQAKWDAEGARTAAFDGFVNGASVVPVGRGTGLLFKALGKVVPRAARGLTKALPKYATGKGRPGWAPGKSEDVLRKAPVGPGGGAKCATCPREFDRSLPISRPRPWDIDHVVKWRTLRPIVRRVEPVFRGTMRKTYNFLPNLRLRCTACNRGDQ